MSCRELLDVVAERGLQVVLASGQPRLKGPKEAITPLLLEVLGLHRDELIEFLGTNGTTPIPSTEAVKQDSNHATEPTDPPTIPPVQAVALPAASMCSPALPELGHGPLPQPAEKLSWQARQREAQCDRAIADYLARQPQDGPSVELFEVTLVTIPGLPPVALSAEEVTEHDRVMALIREWNRCHTKETK